MGATEEFISVPDEHTKKLIWYYEAKAWRDYYNGEYDPYNPIEIYT